MKPPKKKYQAAMAFILITLFIDILGIGIIIPVLPELVKQFIRESDITTNVDSIAGRYVGIIGASYSLMQFLFAPILGALSDRYGRRPVLLASLFGLGVDFLIQGFAPTIGWLFLGRIVAGIMGASFTTANAYIADISTDENRARNFGLVGVMFGLGFIFGPVLGGQLGGISLRLPFFVSAALALLNCAYGYFILPESLPVDRRSSFELSKANPLGAVGKLKSYPIVAGLATAFVCMSLAQRGLENVWVLFTGYRFGWNEVMNGRVLGLVGISAAIVQGGLVRPFTKRFGERTTVLIGLSVSILAFLSYGLSTQPWMIYTTIAFGAIGGVTGPAIQSIVAGTVDPADQGKVQGAWTSLISLTNIFAPILFTYGLFGYFTSEDAPIDLPGAPFLVGAVLRVFALIIVIRVFARFPRIPVDENG